MTFQTNLVYLLKIIIQAIAIKEGVKSNESGDKKFLIYKRKTRN
jgi:hypothetical protein